MSWLSKFGGFDETQEIQEKAMDLQVQAPNKYIEQLVKTMWWSNNLKFDADSTSFVEDGYGGNVDIYSIINYVITTASNVPFKVQILEKGKYVDDFDSELLDRIQNPNPLTNYSLFIEETLGWKLIDGALYVYGPRLEIGPNKGQALEIWTMPSTNMMVVGGDIRKPIEGFKYSHWDDTIPVEDVLYLRYFNPVAALNSLAGSLTGMSPLRAAVLTAKKSNSAAQAGVSAYENNGAIGIVSKASNEWAKFSPETAKAMDERWKLASGGATNYGKIAYTDGNIDFHRLNMSPAELRLGESELQSKRQMAALYKVPTQLLNDAEGATFSNQREAQKSVYTNTIIPEMRSLGEGFTKWLGEAYYPKHKIRIIPDTSNIEVLQTDKKEMVGWLNEAWWLTPNRKLEIMEEPVSDNPKMDEEYVPNNITNINDLDLLAEITPNVGSGGDNEE